MSLYLKICFVVVCTRFLDMIIQHDDARWIGKIYLRKKNIFLFIYLFKVYFFYFSVILNEIKVKNNDRNQKLP